LRRGKWNILDNRGDPLIPVATPEEKSPDLSSVYAMTKYAQERLSLIVGQAYGVSVVALRFFNIFGPRQALSNPYTGVLAIFASRLLNGSPPLIYEDGKQIRDFVHVRDAARACRAALEAGADKSGVYNIGSGSTVTVQEIAERLARIMGRDDILPIISGQARLGDIRHCFGDIRRARRMLGYDPAVTFDAGLAELAEWLGTQVAIDQVEAANAELARRGLVA
jgi:dTDP-L-rhamnose 4-epimerase